MGRVEEAIALLKETERTNLRLIADTPEERVKLRLQRLNNLTRVMLAEMYNDGFTPSLNQPVEAMRYRNLVSENWQQHLDLDPNDNGARSNLAICDSESALTQLLLDPGDAEHRARRGLRIFNELVKATPADTHLAPRRARAQLRLGVVLTANGKLAEALALLRDSAVQQRELASRQPDNQRLAGSLVWTLTALAHAEWTAANAGAARTLLDEAIARSPRLAKSLDVGDRRYSGASLFGIGGAGQRQSLQLAEQSASSVG